MPEVKGLIPSLKWHRPFTKRTRASANLKISFESKRVKSTFHASWKWCSAGAAA